MKSKGFSLIELIVVITIIGILSSIAVPSYQNYLIDSRRNDAKTSIMIQRSNLEQFFYENNYNYCGYAPDPDQPTVVLAANESQDFTSKSGYYNIRFKITSCSDDFKIFAYPKTDKSQAVDQTCKWFVSSSADQEEAYTCNSSDTNIDACSKNSSNSSTSACWK